MLTQKRFSLTLVILLATLALDALGQSTAPSSTQTILTFDNEEIGKPIPTYTQQGVTFTLAAAPRNSRAAGRVMFFPHLDTTHKGILNAMANEQAIPVQARFPAPVSSVTITFWASTRCPALLEAYDKDDHLVDKASLASAPDRTSPADPVPTFDLTVKSPNIAYIRFSGPRNGEFLAVQELRFTPFPASPPN